MRKTLLIAMAMLANSWAWSTPIVITHPDVHLQASDVHDVFTGAKQFAGTIKLVPIDNAQAQEAFLTEVLKSDANKYRHIWTRKAFQEGQTPPDVRSSDAEVLEFVKHTPGAVGYVSTEPKGGVNVVK